jgi:hypothetical protein
MSSRPFTHRLRRRVVASGAAFAVLAFPLAGSCAASNAGGADKPRPATFGDCKNSNLGLHNGYDCEAARPVGSFEGLAG